MFLTTPTGFSFFLLHSVSEFISKKKRIFYLGNYANTRFTGVAALSENISFEPKLLARSNKHDESTDCAIFLAASADID